MLPRSAMISSFAFFGSISRKLMQVRAGPHEAHAARCSMTDTLQISSHSRDLLGLSIIEPVRKLACGTKHRGHQSFAERLGLKGQPLRRDTDRGTDPTVRLFDRRSDCRDALLEKRFTDCIPAGTILAQQSLELGKCAWRAGRNPGQGRLGIERAQSDVI